MLKDLLLKVTASWEVTYTAKVVTSHQRCKTVKLLQIALSNSSISDDLE